MSPKYEVPDDHWEQDEPELDEPDRTTVKTHKIDIVYEVDPGHKDWDIGYGREKYTVHLNYDEEFGGVHVTHVVEHRWKGNYWRDVTDWDFKDIPEPVRQRVASVLPGDRPADLDTDIRVIDEGGESRWQKYHKPRMESYQGGGHMWAESLLKEVVEKLDGAAEQFDDGDAEERLEGVVADIQELAGELRVTAQEGDSHE